MHALVALGPGGEPRRRCPPSLRSVRLGRLTGLSRGIALAGKFGTCDPRPSGSSCPGLDLAPRPGSMSRKSDIPAPPGGPAAPRPAAPPTRTRKDFLERHHHHPPAGRDGPVVPQAK